MKLQSHSLNAIHVQAQSVYINSNRIRNFDPGGGGAEAFTFPSRVLQSISLLSFSLQSSRFTTPPEPPDRFVVTTPSLNLFTSQSLIIFCLKCGNSNYAHYMLDEMLEQDVGSWTTSIQGCVAQDKVWEGSEPPDSVAVFFLNTIAKLECLVFKAILYELFSGEGEFAQCFSNLLVVLTSEVIILPSDCCYLILPYSQNALQVVERCLLCLMTFNNQWETHNFPPEQKIKGNIRATTWIKTLLGVNKAFEAGGVVLGRRTISIDAQGRGTILGLMNGNIGNNFSGKLGVLFVDLAIDTTSTIGVDIGQSLREFCHANVCLFFRDGEHFQRAFSVFIYPPQYQTPKSEIDIIPRTFTISEKLVTHWLGISCDEFFIPRHRLKHRKFKPFEMDGKEKEPIYKEVELIDGKELVDYGNSYAKLESLPLIIELYSSLLPILMYSLLGSSRHHGVGPMSISSLVMESKLSEPISYSQDSILYLELPFTATSFVGFLSIMQFHQASCDTYDFITNYFYAKGSLLRLQHVELDVVLHRKMIYKGNVLAQRFYSNGRLYLLSMAHGNSHP